MESLLVFKCIRKWQRHIDTRPESTLYGTLWTHLWRWIPRWPFPVHVSDTNYCTYIHVILWTSLWRYLNVHLAWCWSNLLIGGGDITQRFWAFLALFSVLTWMQIVHGADVCWLVAMITLQHNSSSFLRISDNASILLWLWIVCVAIVFSVQRAVQVLPPRDWRIYRQLVRDDNKGDLPTSLYTQPLKYCWYCCHLQGDTIHWILGVEVRCDPWFPAFTLPQHIDNVSLPLNLFHHHQLIFGRQCVYMPPLSYFNFSLSLNYFHFFGHKYFPR